MKKLFLSLALLGSTHIYLFSNQITGNTVTPLTWDEQSALNTLYQVLQQDPSLTWQRHQIIMQDPSHNLRLDVDFDYYIGILEKHIQIVEYKIQTKETVWQSKELKVFTIAAGILSVGFFCALAYRDIYEFFTGKYEQSHIPAAMLKTLSSLTFKRAERKKLDLITIKNKVIVYKDIFEQRAYTNAISTLTDSDFKKLNYLARKLAIDNAKSGILTSGAVSLFMTACMLVAPIYHGLYYSEYLESQLEKAQKALQVLQDKKAWWST